MASADVVHTTFGSTGFKKIIVINTHAKLTGKFLYDSPCGIITTSDPGIPLTTFIHNGFKFYNPAIRSLSKAVLIKSGTKTGAEILSDMCNVRELPGSSGLDSKSLKRSIDASCKFTGYMPLSIVPDYQLFLPHGQALVYEGIWEINSKGILVDVSSHFGLKLADEPYQYSKKRTRNPDNDSIKKTMLDEIISTQAVLSQMDPVDPKYESKQQKKSVMNQAFRNFVLSIEPDECIPGPKYVLRDEYTGGNQQHPIFLDKILNIAVTTKVIDAETVVIVMACSVGVDSVNAACMQAQIDINPTILRMGGKYKHKNRKNKIKRTRKNSRNIRRRKTRKIKRRKYKK